MQSFPSACIFVVDVSDPGPSFGSQSFLSVLRDQLEQLGDLLALYPQQTLLSLIQVGATTKDLVRIGKHDIQRWRSGIAKLCLDTTSDTRDSFEQVFDALHRAKDALRAISDWNIMIIAASTLQWPFESEIFRTLSEMDAAGTRIKFLIYPASNNKNLSEQIVSDVEEQNESLLRWLQLEVLVKTGLINTKVQQLDTTSVKPMEIFFKRVVGKLVKSKSQCHRRAELWLNDTTSIELKVKAGSLVRPTLRSAFQLPSASNTTSARGKVGDMRQPNTIIGESTRIPFDSRSKVEANVKLFVLQRMAEYELPAWCEFGPASVLVPSNSWHNITDKGLAKSHHKSNKRRYSWLWNRLSSLDQLLVVWTYWDLGRIETDGEDAHGLLKRYYSLHADISGCLLAKELTVAEQIRYDFTSHMFDVKQDKLEGDEDSSHLALEMSVMMDSIPHVGWDTSANPCGLTTALNRILWPSEEENAKFT